MRLLVSVRSADEAELAARDGADIVDAKEPEAGPLGPVSASVLRRIELALPSAMPLGVALGDAADPDALADLLDRIAPPARADPEQRARACPRWFWRRATSRRTAL